MFEIDFYVFLDVNFDISLIGLIAGCVFFRPDRGSAVPNGEDLAKQTQIYEKYISTLRSYIDRYRSFNKNLLTEVKNTGFYYSSIYGFQVLLMFTSLRELSIEFKVRKFLGFHEFTYFL